MLTLDLNTIWSIVFRPNVIKGLGFFSAMVSETMTCNTCSFHPPTEEGIRMDFDVFVYASRILLLKMFSFIFNTDLLKF